MLMGGRDYCSRVQQEYQTTLWSDRRLHTGKVLSRFDLMQSISVKLKDVFIFQAWASLNSTCYRLCDQFHKSCNKSTTIINLVVFLFDFFRPLNYAKLPHESFIGRAYWSRKFKASQTQIAYPWVVSVCLMTELGSSLVGMATVLQSLKRVTIFFKKLSSPQLLPHVPIVRRRQVKVVIEKDGGWKNSLSLLQLTLCERNSNRWS